MSAWLQGQCRKNPGPSQECESTSTTLTFLHLASIGLMLGELQSSMNSSDRLLGLGVDLISTRFTCIYLCTT